MRCLRIACLAIAVSTGAAAADTPPAAQPPSSYELATAGRSWRIDAPEGPIHVWIPDGYDARTAATVVYVHGYYVDVDTAWTDHRLAEQFAISGTNALFIACSAPDGPDRPVAWPSLAHLLDTVATALDRELPTTRLVAVGHSGAHRTLEHWLRDPALDAIVLVDAAYGNLEPYRRWLRASKNHRLIDVGAYTQPYADRFHRRVPSVIVNGFPTPDAATDVLVAWRAARVLYVRSKRSHEELVTEGVALPMLLRALRAPLVFDPDRIPIAPWPGERDDEST